jgi:hypothetical protein
MIPRWPIIALELAMCSTSVRARGDQEPGRSGRPASGCLLMAEMPREHPEGCNHDTLSLLLSDWPTTPALADCPIPHAALQADHMPHARPRRARDAAERLATMNAASKSLAASCTSCEIVPERSILPSVSTVR